MRFAPHTRGSLATLTLALLVLGGLISLAAAAADPPVASQSGPVGRLVQPRGHAGCIHRKGINRCAPGRFVTSPEDVVVSPDGRFVYVASFGNHAIAIFARNRRTGHLTQLPGRRGCVHHQPADPRPGVCMRARALGGPAALALSPAGANLYVVAAGSDALSVFSRNRRTGALRQLPGGAGCFSQRPGGGCTPVRAMNEPTSVVVSPERPAGLRGRSPLPERGRHLRARRRREPDPGRGDRGLREPRRRPGLRRGPCTRVARGGGGDARQPARDRGRQPEQRCGRAPRRIGRSLSGRWRRRLHRARRRSEGCGVGKALAGAVDLAISRDGRFVYVASSIADAVAILRRDRATGMLTQSLDRRGCISQSGGGGLCTRRPRPRRGLGHLAQPRRPQPLRGLVQGEHAERDCPQPGDGPPRPAARQVRLLHPSGWLRLPRGAWPDRGGRGDREPDGRNVYVASEDTYLGSVAVFRRLVR